VRSLLSPRCCRGRRTRFAFTVAQLAELIAERPRRQRKAPSGAPTDGWPTLCGLRFAPLAGVSAAGLCGRRKNWNDMKPPQPERQNTRVIAIARRFLSLPRVFMSWVCTRWTGRCRWCMSNNVNRDETRLRQKRLKRALRGLPPDHVQESPAKPESAQ
jgi:hypothetical protein